MDWFTMAMVLFGGLALFLFGLDQLSEALKAIAGSGMRKMLGGMTRNRFSSVASGAAITALLQSSSVTTVLMVGFISAGLMSLTQSIGVIMGANIGSTVTAQLVAFNVTDYALILVTAGFATSFLAKHEKVQRAGTAVMGMGLIFFGMGLMSEATRPLRDYEPFIEVMRNMDRPFLGILVGLSFTALIQSSAATTGIVIVLATQGFITLEAGIAIAFGANVGTCVTAVLAALGKPTDARRAAAVHVLFNLLGVLVWLPFIDQLAAVVRDLSPSSPELSGEARLAEEVPRQIANAHTIFNLANTLIFIWFDRFFAKLAIRFIPKKPRGEEARTKAMFLDPVYYQTPALAIDRIELEVGHLSRLVLEMVEASRAGVGLRETPDIALIEKNSRSTEQLVSEILDYGRNLSEKSLTHEDGYRLQQLLAVVNHLRSVADTLSTNFGAIMREWETRALVASEETSRLFESLQRKVEEALRAAVSASQGKDYQLARSVIRQKKDLRGEIDALSKHLSMRLMSVAPDRAETYRLESRVLEIMSRLFFFARHIAKTVPSEEAGPSDHGAE